MLAKASGVVPILAGVTGPAVSGTALLIGLADVVVMAEDAYAFVSGPVPVRQMTGVHVDVEELGGASVHYRDTGVITPIAIPALPSRTSQVGTSALAANSPPLERTW